MCMICVYKHHSEDSMGIVRSYGRREIQFLFKPKIRGAFNETLVIENIHDSTNNQNVVVKALVQPLKTFFIQSLQADFGVCLLGERSRKCKILIANTSNRRRVYEVALDTACLRYTCTWIDSMECIVRVG